MFFTDQDVASMKDVWWFKVKFEYDTGEVDKKGRPKTKKVEVMTQGDSVAHVTRLTETTMTAYNSLRVINVTKTNVEECIGNATIPASLVKKPSSLLTDDDLNQSVANL